MTNTFGVETDNIRVGDFVGFMDAEPRQVRGLFGNTLAFTGFVERKFEDVMSHWTCAHDFLND